MAVSCIRFWGVAERTPSSQAQVQYTANSNLNTRNRIPGTICTDIAVSCISFRGVASTEQFRARNGYNGQSEIKHKKPHLQYNLYLHGVTSSQCPRPARAPTRRNQSQITPFSVQFVPGVRALAFDFAVFCALSKE
eukprot:2685842-Rhodomonas_salina.1